jgi:glycosyltransferase involved in cell wall biosynthesis
MWRIARSERPDVIHTNMLTGFNPAAIGPCAKSLGARLVHSVREYMFIARCGTLFDKEEGRLCDEICPACRYTNPVHGPLIQHLDAVVGVSHFTLNRHLREGMFTHVPVKRVIRNAFAAEPGGKLEHAGPKDVLRLGFLGRVRPVKGIEVLFRECSALPTAVRYAIDIAGSCAPDDQERLTRDHPDVPARFLGFVPQEKLLAGIDILVVPSIWHDPLPRVVMEAYAFGVPVLATRLGGAPEMVDEGETGLLFDPLRPGDLRSKIEELAADPARIKAMGAKALEKSAEYAPERILAKFREVYAP